MAAITITDLNNAKLDVDHIADLANSTNLTAIDRTGATKTTAKGAIESLKAFNSRGAWAAATVYALKDLVSNGGAWYACVVPHTSSAAFATDTASKWRIHQGLVFADLAASTAAAGIGRQSPRAGSVSSTVEAKLTQIVSIQDAGGADTWNGTTGTNNFAALEALAALRPIQIDLPFTGTGVYMLEGTTALTDMAGVVLNPAPGVSIHVKGTGRVQTQIKNIQSTKHLDVYYEEGRFRQPLGSQTHVKPSEKTSFMSVNAGKVHRPIALSFVADAFSVKLNATWPNGTMSRYTPTTTTADVVTHAGPIDTFAGTLITVVPNDQIYAQISTSSNYPSVMVQTDTGWMVLWATIGASGLSSMELVAGVGVTAVSDHAVLLGSAYNLDKSMVGVHIYDEKSFGLIVNGVLVKRFQTTGNIRAAGWSGGFGAAPFTISNPVMFRNKKAAGLANMKLVTIGDSISADSTTLRSHFNMAAQYLTGTGGFQLDTLTNLAVAGETSAQQLVRLEATTLTGYDYCLIQIGVNDIQASTPIATFTANVESMITYCQTNNVIPIVGLPTMWYSQTSAQVYGQDGAATDNSNANIGAGYRLALLRMLATRGVYANTMVIEDQGAVLASLLAHATADGILLDNIHPRVYGSMLMGYAWAKAIAAHATSASNDVVAATPMDAAWFTNSPGTVPTYTARDGDFVTGDYLECNGSTWVNGNVLATLPKRFWPPSVKNLVVQCFNGAVAQLANPAALQIGVDGVVRLSLMNTGASFIAFDASWRI